MQKSKTMKQKLVAQFYQGNIPAFCVAAIISLPLGMLNIGLSWLIQVIIDEMTGESHAMGFQTICLLTLALIISAVVLLLLRRASEPRFVKRAMRQYKACAFEKITEKSLSEFNKESISGYLSALTNDAAQIEQDYLLQQFTLMNQGVTLVGAITMMLWQSPLMTGIAAAFAILPLLVSFITGGRLTASQKRVSDKNAGFTALLSDYLNGFSVIKGFRAEKPIQRMFNSENDELEQEKYRGRQIRQMVGVMGSTAAISAQMGTFLSGAFLAKMGYGITAGQVMLFVNLISVAIQPLSEFPNLLAARRAAVGLIDKLAQKLEAKESEDKTENIQSFTDEIRFSQVCFAYEEGKDVLKDVNLTLQAGEAYAIVGGSGSGKSTLLKLLMGVENGYRGSITLDGHELANIRAESLCEQISVIQQNVFVFNASIRDNMTMFRHFSEERLAQVVEQAHLGELIQTHGMDYLCGENGSRLSGGEKQRISIARSLLKNSSILVADEATASLDAKTAHQVAADLLDLTGVTRVMVTHTLEENLLKRVHRIIALKDGQIAEIGTFDELMEKKGYFYALYTVSH